jgi:hypothetical protein
MKRALLLAALLVSAAGYVFLQTTAPAPQLATLMPRGALLYLEAPDFGRLLRDWDESKVKADWLDSGNYAVFSRSNLFTKLEEVYGQYGEAAGFVPGLQSIVEIAGTDSALALYEIRDVEFLFIGRVADADIMKSQLWAVRDKFEQRQAGGLPFYLRTDPASKRTVAFAFAKGLLLLATRDDLLAQALELLAGVGQASRPVTLVASIASDHWYRDATAAAPNSGELRLVMNLEALVKSVYFRSYWVQRNAATVRRYWAGVADVKRSSGNITETRVFLRTPEALQPARETPGSASPSDLLALVPPDAGLYKASVIADSSEVAALIVQKLIGPQTQRSRDWRYAPMALSPDLAAGSEADLETRIDEQPLPADAGISDSEAAARAMVEKAGARSVLSLQASSPAAGTFVPMGSVIVLAGARDWDRDSVRSALTAAAGKLWTTSQLGAGWVGGTSGGHPIERLDGLGTLMFADRGRLLFLSNDSRLLGAALDRVGTRPPAGAFTFAAGFRHLRERPNYERVMTALDFASSSGNRGPGSGNSQGGTPTFFTGNIASLSRILSQVTEVRVTEEERGVATLQTVRYQLGQ